MWPFTKNIGLVDKVINKRVGILFLDIGYSSISIEEQERFKLLTLLITVRIKVIDTFLVG